MTLNWLQMSWLVATVVFFGALILDIANVIVLPGILLIVIPIALLALSLAAGPSWKEISDAWTRSRDRGGSRS